jgi:putative membrane protein
MNRLALADIPKLLSIAAGVASIGFVVETGDATFWFIVAITTTFFGASIGHAAISRGPRAALILTLVMIAGSVGSETLALQAGLPFGEYSYHGLGWRVLGVPLLVPIAWTMLAYPALVIARKVTRHRVWGSLTAGAILAAWDVLLDPLMVRDGYWRWTVSGPSLAGVPVSNYVAWVVVGTSLSLIVWPVLRPRRDRPAPDDGLPIALYAASGALLLLKAALQDMTDVAVSGAVAMGLVMALATANGRAGGYSYNSPSAIWRLAARRAGNQDASTDTARMIGTAAETSPQGK